MATAAVDFSDNVPMDLHSIADATTNRDTGSVPETKQEIPFDLANVPEGYWERALNPTRMRDMKTAGSQDVIPVPPSIIKVDPDHNPRDYRLPENRAHLDDLKRKIKAAGGVIRALECRWDFLHPDDSIKSIIVVDGECRLRASLELIAEGFELMTVPVKQSDAKNEGDRLIQALMLNEGKSLSQWEMGNAFKRFSRMGWTPEKISERTGHTLSYIATAIEMADAPDEVKEMLSAKAVTPWAALSALRTMHPTAAVQVLKTQVQANKAAGKKGPVKRSKAPTKAGKAPAASAGPVALPPAIKKALMALLADVPATDLEPNIVDGKELNSEVYVNRAKLVVLARALGNELTNRK